MNIVIICVGLAVTAVSVTFIIRDAVRKRARDRRMAEMLKRATDALSVDVRRAALAEAVEAVSKMLGRALIGTSRGSAVPVDSPEGRALLLSALTGGPCSCRNCEESRRIAHAAEKRGES